MIQGNTAERAFFPVRGEFQQRIRSEVCVMQYETSRRAVAPESKLSRVQLGMGDVVWYESHGIQHARRTLSDIRSDRADDFMICLPLSARFHIEHNGVETDLGPGDVAILAIAKPFEAYVFGAEEQGAFSTIQVRLPAPLLRERLPGIDDFCNRKITTDSAAGQFMRMFLDGIAAYAPYVPARQGVLLGAALADVIASASMPAVEAYLCGRPGRKTSHHFIVEKARLYIESRLSDPDLDVPAIAQNCKVSVRCLQNAFSAADFSVAAYVRNRRLQCCREALKEGRLAERSITEIAHEWGFRNVSHFSRLYKAHYRISPDQDRSRRLSRR